MVRPGAFVDETLFGVYMAQWTAHYLDAGGDQARLPGARGARLEAQGRDRGIEISGAIAAELSALGGRVGISFPG
jgi:LDH2 family malate/lactate/ureidoglycolate dehydrogenase